MTAIHTSTAEVRAWDAFAVAARRLERQLHSSEPAEVQQALGSIEAKFRALTPQQRATVPDLAKRSQALQHFLRWREIPRDKKTTVVDVRAAQAAVPKKLSEEVRTLLSSATRAENLAFMGRTQDKRAWLNRATRMVLTAAGTAPNDPEIKDRLRTLSARFFRHGDAVQGKALARAAEGDLGPARRLMQERRAQLSSTPLDDKVARFGKTVAEHTKNAKGEPIVRINGAEIPREDWTRIEAARDRTLALYNTSLSKPSLDGKPLDGLDSLRRFLMLGRPAVERMGLFADRAALSEQRAPIVAKLQALKASGKKVLIYVEGHDAAGKGSSSSALLTALKSAGFATSVRSFKGPTEGERKQHWLKRFEDSVAQNPGALVWDRGPAGNWAYGDPPASALDELHAFEKSLQKDTVVLKLNLRAEPERQAETFGKRWARALIAEELLESPNLSAKEREGLQLIVDTTLSPNDLPAYARFDAIDAKFQAFTAKNSEAVAWKTIDTTSRTVAKEKALAAFDAAIDHALSAASTK